MNRLASTAPPSAPVGVEAPTLPVEINGAVYDVPIRVQVYITQLQMKLEAIGLTKGSHPVLTLLDATEHCLSAADEGEDYGVSRAMLDAMTTLGLMDKVGRGKWAPTEAAERFAAIAKATGGQQ